MAVTLIAISGMRATQPSNMRSDNGAPRPRWVAVNKGRWCSVSVIDAQPRARRGKIKPVMTLHGDQRRNVELFGAARAHGPGHGPSPIVQQIAMLFAKGVFHLAYNRAQGIVRVPAIPDAQRVEDVAQNPRHTQQHHLAASEIDAEL